MKGEQMKKSLFLFCILLSFNACTSHTSSSSTALNVSQKDADYKKGMREACRPIDCGYTRDLKKLKSSESYRQGWEDGLLKCKGIEKGDHLHGI